MKKRKKPVALITVLVLLVAIVTGSNYYRSVQESQTPEQQQKQQAEDQAKAQQAQAANQPTLGDKRAPASKDDIKNSIGQALSAKPTPQKSAMPAPGGPPGGPGGPGPSIARPKVSNYKPVPSDSQIQGQWYSNEHMQELPAAKK